MWSRDIPEANGYYWAKQEQWGNPPGQYMGAEIVRLNRYTYGDGQISAMVMAIGSEDDSRAEEWLWYHGDMMFVPPPFTTDDVVRLGVTA